MSFAWSKAAETREVDASAIKRLRDDLLSVKSKRARFNRAVVDDVEWVAHMPYRMGLFELARRVKARAHECKVTASNGTMEPFLKLLLLHWGNPYPLSAIATEFRHALSCCKRSAGEGALDVAVKQTAEPASWPAVYEDRETNHLLALCIALAQTSDDGVFFIGCRDAARICGYLSPNTASYQLKQLMDDEWIELAEAHTTVRARRFRLGRKSPNYPSRGQST